MTKFLPPPKKNINKKLFVLVYLGFNNYQSNLSYCFKNYFVVFINALYLEANGNATAQLKT